MPWAMLAIGGNYGAQFSKGKPTHVESPEPTPGLQGISAGVWTQSLHYETQSYMVIFSLVT